MCTVPAYARAAAGTGIIDHGIPAYLRQVLANQREMMVGVGLADGADPFQGRLVADVASQGIARVRRVDDDAARAQHTDGLADEAQLGGDGMELQVDGHVGQL